MATEEEEKGVTASEWERVQGDPFVVWWLRLARAAERERKALEEAEAKTDEPTER